MQVASIIDPRIVATWSRDGKPLPSSLRAELEAHFSTDLRDVRVHVGLEPATVGAAAFCHGEHLYFSPGLYPADTDLKRHVLLHEIGHVIQQRRGQVLNPFGHGVAMVIDPALEASATDSEKAPVASHSGGRLTGSVIQPIQYLHTSEIGHSHRGEEGTPGVRIPTSVAVTDHENRLKAHKIAVRRLRVLLDRLRAPPRPAAPGARPLPPIPATRIKAVEDELREADMLVRVFTQWLQRQDFVLKDDGSIDWPASERRVIYDRDAAQTATRIYGHEGRLFVDVAHTTPLNTRPMVTHASGPGFAIYVMSQEGNIHVSMHKIGHRHHSSLLAGGKTAGAGELQTDKDGKLLWLSNKSGHYRPSPIHLNQVIHQLDKLRVPRTYRIQEWEGTGRVDYTNANEYLRLAERRGESPVYEFQKLLPYILENDEIDNDAWVYNAAGPTGPGFYDKASGVMVPHKVVRKWLKANGSKGEEMVSTGHGR